MYIKYWIIEKLPQCSQKCSQCLFEFIAPSSISHLISNKSQIIIAVYFHFLSIISNLYLSVTKHV